MTATSITTDPHLDALARRLEELRVERELARSELASDSSGDIADRATNVDANIRFALLEQRIQAVELELQTRRRDRSESNGTVAVGDVVTLDLGDGPETFLFGSVEQAAGGLDVVTPGSPLGAALAGATVGSSVSYRTRSGTRTATIVAVS